MPLFRYEVVDRDGKSLMGAMSAASEAEVRQRLTSQGYTVGSVSSTGPARTRAKPGPAAAAAGVGAVSGPTSRVSAPPNELAVFLRSLASYVTSGVNMYDGLMHIARQTPDRGMRIVSERMAARVQSGQRLSEAMMEYPRAFPAHVVGVVAAGELGGFLPIVIGDMALDYELAQRASSRWIRFVSRLLWAHGYGLLLIAPILPMIFSPGTTDIGVGLARYARFAGLYVALPLAVLTIGYHVAAAVLRRPHMRPVAHRLILRVPGGVAHASRMRSLASFSRILWRLQNAGILPIRAWDAASRAAENLVVAAGLYEQVPAIRSGRKFSEALAMTGHFRSDDQRVLAAGETAGQTADVLQRIAAYYEDAAQSAAGRVRWFGLRITILLNILGFGAVGIGFALMYQNMFSWVDWFMGTGQ